MEDRKKYPHPGRPTKNAVRINITMPANMVAWLEKQGPKSSVLQDLVSEAMKKDNSPKTLDHK
jgi:hypothetical protein